MLQHHTPPHAQALAPGLLLEPPADVSLVLPALLPQHPRDSLALALMVPIIAFLLFCFWWLPATIRMLPLPRTGILRTLRRLGKCVIRFLTRLLTFVLIRPAQRVAQRHGWFVGLWTFCLLLSLLLTILINLFPLPGGIHIMFIPLLFVIGGGVLLKAFPYRFHSRALYPLPRRRRRQRWHKPR